MANAVIGLIVKEKNSLMYNVVIILTREIYKIVE